MLDGGSARVQSSRVLAGRVVLTIWIAACAALARAAEPASSAPEPWFTGPLEAPGSAVVAPGQLALEPSLALSNGRASYGQSGQLLAARHPDITIDAQLLAQYGVVERLQISVIGQAAWNRDGGRWASGFGDTTLGLGIALLTEDPESLVPGLRLDLQTTLPTGEYQHLDADRSGSDATGSGAYTAALSLNAAKTLTLAGHAFRPHAAIAVDVYASHVSVHGPNAYGGGAGTSGTVSPGRSLTAYLSGELSLTQRWALALDLVYSRAGRTTFRGEPGQELDGSPASVGNGSSELITIAPALEYSRSADRGVIGGLTFDLAGRNASQAIGVQVQYSGTFELW